MQPDELIDALGGTNAVAHLLGIRPPSVSGWRESRRIPEDKLVRLAVIAEARNVTTRKALFPEAWREIWPELADAEAGQGVSHA